MAHTLCVAALRSADRRPEAGRPERGYPNSKFERIGNSRSSPDDWLDLYQLFRKVVAVLGNERDFVMDCFDLISRNQIRYDDVTFVRILTQ